MKRAGIMIALLCVLCGVNFSAWTVNPSGYLRQDLDWDFTDNSLSLTSQFNVDLELADTTEMTANLRLQEDGLDRAKLSCTWEERPYRLKWKLQFDVDGFDTCRLEWRYRKDPWEVKLIPTIEAGDPFSWSLDVSYETDEFSVQLTPEFTELFSFSSFKGKATFSPLSGWTLRSTINIDPSATDGQVSCEQLLTGKTSLGDFSFTYDDLHLTAWSYDRDFSADKVWAEFSFDWEEGEAGEYEWYGEYEATEDSGYEADIVIEATQPLTISTAKVSFYAQGWKVGLDFIKQQISCTMKRYVTGDTRWELDLSFDLDDEEYEVESYWENDLISFDIDLTCTKLELDELSIEFELDF